MGKQEKNDKFYTSNNIIEDLVNSITNIEQYDQLIEPSAGNGSFTKKLEKKYKQRLISLDILPEYKNIKKQNWFDYIVDETKENIMVIGNPPFGDRNHLSISFLKKCFKNNNIKTIAFILPNVFNKESKQKLFSKDWFLEVKQELPKNSFYVKRDDTEYEQIHIPCTFYVWTKHKVKKDLRFNWDKYRTHKDFKITDKEDADFYILGAAPKTIKEVSEVTSKNRGYYIKSNIDINTLKNRILNINWKEEGNSSVSGGVSWFSKAELIYTYDKSLEKNVNN